MTRKLLTALALLLITVSCQVTTEESSSNNGENNVIASFAPLATQTVPNGDYQSVLASVKLPENLIATIDGKENQIINGVTWELNGTYTQKKETQTITFTAKLPDGYKLASGVVAPTITVTVNAPIPEDGQYDSLTIKNGVVTKCDKSATTVKIPDGVTSIGEWAFDGCSSLTSVTIPISVTSIEYFAFDGCDNIDTVTYNGTLVQWCALDNDKCLMENAKHIKLSDVPDLKKLTELTIPNNVISIGASAFQNCSKLTSVTIPISVTSIEYFAFDGCENIDTVTYKGTLAQWCTMNNDPYLICSAKFIKLSDESNLQELTTLTIPNGVTSIGFAAFAACSNLTSITIPNSVTSIGGGAFIGCSKLTSVTIPGSVTSIGYVAFGGCSSLTSVTIQNGVTSIGEWAFDGCSSLTSVTIPNSVTSIGGGAFYECSNLKTVNYGGTQADWEKINIDSGSSLRGKTIIGSDGTSWVCE